MIIIKVIILIVIALGSIIFFINAVSALIETKRNMPDILWNSTLLLWSGVCSFIMIIFFCIFMMDNLMKDIESKTLPKYELITTPVYKQING